MLNKFFFKIFALFKFFFNCIEYNINKYIQICINNNKKYFNENFIKYIVERNIQFKSIIIKNFQINNNVERFNQIIICKINIFLNNNDIVFK